MMTNEKRYAEWLTGVKHLVYKEKVLKQTEIAKMVGVQKEHINAVMKERRAAGDVLQDNISVALGLSYDSIRTLGQLILEGVPGEEALELAKAGDKPFPAILGTLDDPLFVSVPKAKSKLSAGGGCFAEEGVSGEYHFRSEWLHSICSPKDAILFDCQGDSMAPFISDGETVLVDRGDTEFQDDKVFAIGVGDTALVKRLRLTLDNRIEVISDNPDKGRHPSEVVSPGEIRILGRVRWRAGEV